MDSHLKAIEFEPKMMRLIFGDGGSCLVPLDSFTRLLHASDIERRTWEIIGNNRGIHWPLIDEDLSILRLIEDYAHPISSLFVSSATQERHV
jgi:hypothetical protein